MNGTESQRTPFSKLLARELKKMLRVFSGSVDRGSCWRFLGVKIKIVLRMLSILLLVQKSGDHQLRLVVYPIIYRVRHTFQVGFRRISEPSTVASLLPAETLEKDFNY